WFEVVDQAGDGIRYGHVTGVQTCALPSWEGDTAMMTGTGYAKSQRGEEEEKEEGKVTQEEAVPAPKRPEKKEEKKKVPPKLQARSEERRVGKECRRGRRRATYKISERSV